ncbi:MAG: choice-of-anchor D domain-containing protein [Bacteroidota bacterium]|nr:choice-of-anchor D domain-containing protein [Bacteroidota bacterium]MDP4234601.1 choice-of-anchor D domain-containing protein [Bacteroidota bacterium]MDP4243800.1 choice-of-anchor D domain-containing protein [Bacteroidota bacterium]MDP4288962.1 choice-of-anchor D domain-containing protein [Bacteroidota bacterium]
MKVLLRTFLSFLVICFLSVGTASAQRTLTVTNATAGPEPTGSSTMVQSGVPWLQESYPASQATVAPARQAGFAPLGATDSISYFDGTAPAHDWLFPFQAGNLYAVAAAERFTLPNDSGYLDSLNFLLDRIVGDSLTIAIYPDTVITTAGGPFHFVNIFSSTAKPFAALTIPAPQASGAVNLKFRFPHVLVTKNFHVVLFPRVVASGTNLTATSQFIIRADSEAVHTPSLSNAHSTFIGINLQGGTRTTGIMDGYFTPTGNALPLYLNFAITAWAQSNAPVPTLSLSRTSYDFGNVALGASPSFGIKLSNTGSNDVAVTDIAVTQDGPDFSVPTPITPFVVKAGKNTFVSVKFAPTNLGPQSATAILTMDDGSTLQIALTGTGVANGGVDPTGVDNSAVIVYPNPTANALRIDGAAEGATVELLDMLGRSVLRTKIVNEQPLDVSSLVPGRYEAVGHSGASLWKVPVIIQR